MGHKFNCSYAEFEFDNIVNRIIKYTCRGLVNSTTSAENKKIIRQVLIRMNEVSDVRCVPSDCDGIRLSKLNRQYTVLLSMSKMFLLSEVANLDISGFNTANVTDMGGMFGGCDVTKLNLSGFNTANVTNMNDMFSTCYKLTYLDLSGFDTAKVTDMEGMFNRCKALTTLICEDEKILKEYRNKT